MMKSRSILSLLAIFLIALIADDAYGQRRNRYGYKRSKKSKKFSKYSGGRVGYAGVGNPKYTTVGFSINNNNYFGDIAPDKNRFSSEYKFIPDGVGFTVSKVLYPGIFARGGFNWGNIKASDYSSALDNVESDNSALGRWSRNYHFKNAIYELNAGFEIDMIPSNSGARGRFPINPYLYFGVAGFHHSPKAKAPLATIDVDGDGELDVVDQARNKIDVAPGSWVDLHSLGTEGQNFDSLGAKPYSKFQFAIPFGFGVKFRLPGNFDLNFEMGFRYLFTDYLDDIGGQYADLDGFGDNYLARAMSERGGERYDAFTGSERGVGGADPYGFTITNTTVQYDYSSNPESTWTGSDTYIHGFNYVVGGNRGGPNFNDIYVTTQIRLVYILDKRGVSKGKFR